MPVVVVCLGAALLVLPGLAIARALGLSWAWSVTLAAPLSFGLVGAVTVPFGVLGVPWDPVTAAGALVGILVILLTLRRRWPGLRWWAPDGVHSGAAMRWPALGIVIGQLTIGATGLRALLAAPGGVASVPQTSDELWHANAVRFIAATGQGSPLRMGALLNPETLAPHYYPLAMHDLFALVVRLTGASPALVLNLGSLTVAALLVPVGAACLGWAATQAPGRAHRGHAVAAAAGALSGLAVAYPHIELSVGVLPEVVALAMVGPLVAALASGVEHPARRPAAVLAVIGVTSVHPIGLVLTAIILGLWWLFSPQVTRRSVGLLAMAVPVALALVVLAPQLRALLSYGGTVTTLRNNYADRPLRVLGDAVIQQTKTVDVVAPPWVLLALAALGIAVAVRWRAAWLPLTWALLVVLTVQAASPLPGLGTTVLQPLTSIFYSDSRRIAGVTAVLLVPMAAVGLVGLAQAPLWHRALGRARAAGAPVLPTLTVVALLASVPGLLHVPQVYRSTWNGEFVSPADQAAFAALAAMPGAHDGLVLDSPVDGTGWVYATQGLRPVFAHYALGETGPAQQLLLAALDRAGDDPAVDAALRKLGVRYVITSTPVFSRLTLPRGFVDLDDAPGLRRVYDNGETKIYRVLS
ncbi:MAG: DUF6541 family protein [Mycobacteriaceae bacterium]